MTAAPPLRETAYAKLNLALHVRERMPDGFHRIETIFAFCEDGDVLEAAPADDLILEVTGPFAGALGSESDNLVIQAARALRERFAIGGGARISLVKSLPVAAGIGGGSADAAAALRLLARLWGIAEDDRFEEIAFRLGADVPACLASCAAIGRGRGDRLSPSDDSGLPAIPALLVNPGHPLATGAVFARWDEIDRGGLAEGGALEAALSGRNDLEPPARTLLPVIGDVLQDLAARPGVRLARMSGSGATCFALFDTAASRDAADVAIAASRPGWWRLATALR